MHKVVKCGGLKRTIHTYFEQKCTLEAVGYLRTQALLLKRQVQELAHERHSGKTAMKLLLRANMVSRYEQEYKTVCRDLRLFLVSRQYLQLNTSFSLQVFKNTWIIV